MNITVRFLFLTGISGLLLLSLIIRPAEADSGQHVFFIKNSDIREDVSGKSPVFPKYCSQIINLANQNAQGTRPKMVGQMSELIQAFPGKGYGEWVQWYQQQQPEAIDRSAEKIYAMIVKMRDAMNQIDETLVKKWVENLVLTQSYAGLHFQQSILKQIAEQKKTSFRLAEPEEESKGIDGYIGTIPVSVKPVTYRSKDMLPERMDVKIIWYEKKKGGIRVIYDF